MPVEFITLTQDDLDKKIAEGINSRETELNSYYYELQSHQNAIDALGDIAWDDTTMKYRGLDRDVFVAMAIADGCDSTKIQAISDLLALDYHKHNLEVVKIEIAKSERHYNNLLAALPAGDRRDNAIAAVMTTEEATPAIKAS